LANGPIVIKYGGNAMDGSTDFLAEVASVAATTPVVLVHGGGPEIDRWLSERGVVTERIEGLRVTDDVTLEITEAVLCGTLNKRIVRALAALGVRAAGISGEDGGTLVARPVENHALGHVGEITACDPHLTQTLLAAGFLPVIAPLATGSDGHALNVNADLAAAAIAAALRARAFVMITNVPRVLRDVADPASVIDRLSLADARAFARSDACAGGMKPKIEAAIAAVSGGSLASYICGPQPLEATLAGEATVIE
jgi:acetylglutamate kinase